MSAAGTLQFGAGRTDSIPYLKGGKTTVELSSEFVGAQGLTPSSIRDGKFENGTAFYKIPADAIDAETLAGDIFHTDGLGLGVRGIKSLAAEFQHQHN